jgi:hypothetical protein
VDLGVARAASDERYVAAVRPLRAAPILKRGTHHAQVLPPDVKHAITPKCEATTMLLETAGSVGEDWLKLASPTEPLASPTAALVHTTTQRDL